MSTLCACTYDNGIVSITNDKRVCLNGLTNSLVDFVNVVVAQVERIVDSGTNVCRLRRLRADTSTPKT